ncbi:MAG: DNA-damage-inducible protein J [Candidatus Peregrinibacteria bacterium Greene0416_19]|nr:MAG: DNA-damage-inducible protein J [Candidatus Peregrinibacteria bacterium Greene0416_19]
MALKNLQVRLDENLRKRAEKVFKKLGMDTPTAIRVFFTKVADVGGIPFLLQTEEDAYTPGQIRQIDHLAARAKRGKGMSAGFSSVDLLLDDLRR